LDPVKAAELLEGVLLDEGWTVGPPLRRGPDATGGRFSVCYLVERPAHDAGVETGLLRALDFSAASGMSTPIADALQLLTRAYTSGCTSDRTVQTRPRPSRPASSSGYDRGSFGVAEGDTVPSHRYDMTWPSTSKGEIEARISSPPAGNRSTTSERLLGVITDDHD
jgi:hypothetical protein